MKTLAFHFPREKCFFIKCRTSCILKINTLLDLKQNKRLLDTKSWKPLDSMVCCMDQSLYGYIYFCTTVELISWRIKNNKAEDYTHKYNRSPFLEEKKLYKSIYSHRKYQKCLPCYMAKLIFCSRFAKPIFLSCSLHKKN